MSNLSEPAPTRRAVLTAAGAGAAAFAIPGFIQAASAKSTGPTPADWTALAKDLSGPLYRPGESGYPTASILFDPRFDSIHPAGVAYCRSPHDVATCLAFVRKFKIPTAARCGGHSYAGWSSSTGLVMDVTRMSGVTVSGSTVTVGAGTRLIDFYHALAAKGRAVPGGSCPTVGISGLTLGGGVGVVGRAYGLTCDRLESLQVVTANGAVLTCDSKNHSDMYWACRGGGGGNFGVVTSFTFSTVPAPSPWLFFLRWPWSQAARVISAWQSWAPHAPDQLWSNMHLAAVPGGTTPTVEVGGTYIGSISSVANLLDQLYAKAGSRPTGSNYFLNQFSYLNAMLIEAGCNTGNSGYTECHLPWTFPGGRLNRQPQFAKSDIFTKPLSSAGIGTLLRGIENLQHVQGAGGGVGGIAFDALGGAINRVSPSATAFVHRDGLFQAQYTTDWNNGANAKFVNNQHAWLRSFWSSMRPYASGQAYQNYIDPDLTNWQSAYYGANYARLRQVKKTYDPTRVFNFPQAIQPA
ncbi:MAG TPA: FAD-binding oxidoreductase [Trebonia sp.]|nr:FAD-binding oxidoreductase [Trebonia sp.]